MIEFSALILQFAEKSEKTGWTYIEVPAAIAGQLKPDTRKSFRVKGYLDGFAINGVALVPMGEGDFILPLNKDIRKGIGKNKGAIVHAQLEADDDFRIGMPPYLSECLDEDSQASAFFYKLSKSHQNYYLNWVNSAKTEPTQIKRIAQMLNALVNGLRFDEMMRALKKRNE